MEVSDGPVGSAMEGGARMTEWPADEIERVTCCPVCGHLGRRLLHGGLTDKVFQCAPGEWDSHQCLSCGAAFLDPRPTMASIWRAYTHYYTHNTPVEPVAPNRTGGLRWIRRALRNGYVNGKYGTHLQPSSSFGRWVVPLLGNKRGEIDHGLRYLPPRWKRAPGSVLDIGCGDGSFLRTAMELGWKAMGIDPDPRAAGLVGGVRVQQGGLPVTGLASASYDVVTLSHVIEHTHDPVASLREVFRLLRPGGQVWIATPNVHSEGHQRFGRDWIGLHPPAHLVLFSHEALRHALRLAGFEPPRLCAMHSQVGQDHMSWRLSRGELPFSPGAAELPASFRIMRMLSDLRCAWQPDRREEIEVTARRPCEPGTDGQACSV